LQTGISEESHEAAKRSHHSRKTSELAHSEYTNSNKSFKSKPDSTSVFASNVSNFTAGRLCAYYDQIQEKRIPTKQAKRPECGGGEVTPTKLQTCFGFSPLPKQLQIGSEEKENKSRGSPVQPLLFPLQQFGLIGAFRMQQMQV
jgi:hypothetical protein